MAISGVTDYTNTYAISRTNESNGVSGSTQEYKEVKGWNG